MTPVTRVRVGPAPHAPSALAIAMAVLLAALSPGAVGAASIFGLVDTGELFVSADGGASWSIRSVLPVRDAVAMAAGSTSTQLFLASESGSFYRSADAGMSWMAVGAVPASDVTAMVSRAGTLLLFARGGAVYSSADEGASFAAVGAITSSEVVSATQIGGTYFAVSGAGEVFRSSDQGASWSAVGVIGGGHAVEMVAFDNKLHVLTATGDLAQSDGTGASWSFVSTLSQSGMSTLAAGTGELLASTEAGETAASSSGASWAWRGAIGQLVVRALATDIPTTTDVRSAVAPELRFAPPWPNPAQGRVTLALDLDTDAVATVEVFDAGGRLVATPVRAERFSAGHVTRSWRPGRLAAGTYYLRARVGERSRTRLLVWIGK